jgi:hypothetical protein
MCDAGLGGHGSRGWQGTVVGATSSMCGPRDWLEMMQPGWSPSSLPQSVRWSDNGNDHPGCLTTAHRSENVGGSPSRLLTSAHRSEKVGGSSSRLLTSAHRSEKVGGSSSRLPHNGAPVRERGWVREVASGWKLAFKVPPAGAELASGWKLAFKVPPAGAETRVRLEISGKGAPGGCGSRVRREIGSKGQPGGCRGGDWLEIVEGTAGWVDSRRDVVANPMLGAPSGVADQFNTVAPSILRTAWTANRVWTLKPHRRSRPPHRPPAAAGSSAAVEA